MYRIAIHTGWIRERQLAQQQTSTKTAGHTTQSEGGRLVRTGLWALPVYGALTLWATRTHQPDRTVDFAAYAAYISRPAFFWEHLFGSIGGTVAALLGAAALFALLARGSARRWALAGLVTGIAGNALMLTLFGVAAFVSPVIGDAYLAGDPGVAALNEEIYTARLGLTGAAGALLYSVSAVLFAIALWRSGRIPRWTAPVYGSTGLLIALFGLFIGIAQTAGAALLIVSTVAIARSASQQRHVGNAATPAQHKAGVR